MTNPYTIAELDSDLRTLKRRLRDCGYPSTLLSAIETRALRSGRRQTGVFQSNRMSRWKLVNDHPAYGADPQYGTEADCKNILLVLLLTMLEFKHALRVDDPLTDELARKYLGRAIEPDSYRDALLLEFLDFRELRAEAENPTHGRSNFHIGHIDPTRQPKHVPDNVGWRTLRSNLIQGDMTLREARIYIVKLIARYFELGEIDIS